MSWLLVAVLMSIGFVQTMRWTQHARGSVALVGWVNYLLAALFYAGTLVFSPPERIDWRILLLGSLTGAVYVSNYYLFSAVIRRIGVGLTSAAGTLAVVVPVTVSVAYGEPWFDKAPGLGVAMIALPLVALGGARLSGPAKPVSRPLRLLWVSLAFLAAGTENSLFKIAERTGGAGFGMLFLPALFITAAIVSTPAVLITRPALRGGDVIRGLVLGTCNIAANFCLSMAIQQLDGPLVFPVKLNGIVIGSTLLGWLIWRERLSRMALAGVAMTLLSTVLLNRAGLLALLRGG